MPPPTLLSLLDAPSSVPRCACSCDRADCACPSTTSTSWFIPPTARCSLRHACPRRQPRQRRRRRRRLLSARAQTAAAEEAVARGWHTCALPRYSSMSDAPPPMPTAAPPLVLPMSSSCARCRPLLTFARARLNSCGRPARLSRRAPDALASTAERRGKRGRDADADAHLRELVEDVAVARQRVRGGGGAEPQAEPSCAAQRDATRRSGRRQRAVSRTNGQGGTRTLASAASSTAPAVPRTDAAAARERVVGVRERPEQRGDLRLERRARARGRQQAAHRLRKHAHLRVRRQLRVQLPASPQHSPFSRARWRTRHARSSAHAVPRSPACAPRGAAPPTACGDLAPRPARPPAVAAAARLASAAGGRASYAARHAPSRERPGRRRRRSPARRRPAGPCPSALFCAEERAARARCSSSAACYCGRRIITWRPRAALPRQGCVRGAPSLPPAHGRRHRRAAAARPPVTVVHHRRPAPLRRSGARVVARRPRSAAAAPRARAALVPARAPVLRGSLPACLPACLQGRPQPTSAIAPNGAARAHAPSAHAQACARTHEPARARTRKPARVRTRKHACMRRSVCWAAAAGTLPIARSLARARARARQLFAAHRRRRALSLQAPAPARSAERVRSR
eukprot:scaffold4781_cov339-Prasinococcus_capsulatus_cf.AAC.12